MQVRKIACAIVVQFLPLMTPIVNAVPRESDNPTHVVRRDAKTLRIQKTHWKDGQVHMPITFKGMIPNRWSESLEQNFSFKNATGRPYMSEPADLVGSTSQAKLKYVGLIPANKIFVRSKTNIRSAGALEIDRYFQLKNNEDKKVYICKSQRLFTEIGDSTEGYADVSCLLVNQTVEAINIPAYNSTYSPAEPVKMVIRANDPKYEINGQANRCSNRTFDSRLRKMVVKQDYAVESLSYKRIDSYWEFKDRTQFPADGMTLECLHDGRTIQAKNLIVPGSIHSTVYPVFHLGDAPVVAPAVSPQDVFGPSFPAQ